MTKSGKSVFYFGIYVIGTGLLFILIPGQITALTQLPPIPSGWGSILGLLALIIGSYDITTGLSNLQPLIKVSVYVRFGFTIGTILLFLTGQMPVSILALGSVDALGALWTLMALKAEASN